MKRKTLLDFLVPISILILLTLPFWLTDVDITFSQLFYNQEQAWFRGNAGPWPLLYNYGNIPALTLAGCGLFMFLLGLIQKRFAPWRKTGLFLILFFLLGPGLLVNTVFKDHWGRPRPADIKEMGGPDRFLPVWVKGEVGKGKSFPSGHASVGFFLFAPFFVLRQKMKERALFFLWLGLLYGSLLGFCRIIQGGHFLSDVLWAGGFVYLTGLLLSYVFRFGQEVPVQTRVHGR